MNALMNCLSVKNKKSKEQCNRKQKEGSSFCGIHARAKKVILYNDEEYYKTTDIDVNNVNNVNNINNVINISNKHCDCNNLSNNLKSNIKRIGTGNKNNIVKIKIIDSTLDDKLNDVNTENNVDKIIKNKDYYATKIQSIVRRYLVVNRSKSSNDVDFCTYESNFDTPSIYFFMTVDKSYFFDIRSLNKLYEMGKLSNPYTMKPFTHRTIHKFKKHIKYLQKKGIKINYESNDGNKSEDQLYMEKLINVFQKFDELDNYTDVDWFNNLSFHSLKKLYFAAEDIWNYRIQMPIYRRNRIVSGGLAFNHNVDMIRFMPPRYKRELQNIILDEFERFVSCASDINDRKIGAMLMMTALVEVSPDAAESMPQYVQNF